MSKTLENLMAAFRELKLTGAYVLDWIGYKLKTLASGQLKGIADFAGESQANRKYLAYAQAADKEGLSGVAKVFRAAAAAETIHAHTHLKNAGKIGDTAANLQDAIGGETYEFTKMYPEMIKDAEAEGQTAVAKYMDMVNKVEEVHANLYKKAAADNHAFDNVDFYVCKVCGYTHEGPCDSCPVCGAKAAAFFKVDDACCLNK